MTKVTIYHLPKPQLNTYWGGLRTLLCDWDPIGVMNNPEWPQDEYDCLIGPLLSLLMNGSSNEDIASYLHAEITEHFGLNDAYYDFEDIARRITSWFNDR
jgi:hypothetical protein